MTHRTSSALGRGIEALALMLGAAAALWLVSVVLVQAAYPMLPVQPSAAAIRLAQEARQRPLYFENGLRYAGFLAPVGRDPLEFGRCVYPDVEERARQVLDGQDLPSRSRTELHSAVTGCLQGQSLLEPPKPGPSDWAMPSWTEQDWLTLAGTSPNPTLKERADQVWRHGPLRLGTDFDRPDTQKTPLIWLAQWRAASALGLWHDGHREEALRTWTTSTEQALGMVGDDLVETMIAATVMTRQLLSLQAAIRSSDRLDDTSAATARRLATLVDSLPVALDRALISEWQGMEHTIRKTHSSVATKWQGKREEDPDEQHLWMYALSFFDVIYDPVDSVNVLSTNFEVQRVAALSAANGVQPALVPPSTSCSWLGRFWHVCRPHERNPVGRWLARQPLNYIPYGTRIADLRNLAAATRMTIEARRLGLSGEALARFIDHAPDDMRDVFTRQPFAYNPQARELTIVLRHKSTVLGDTGEYRLPL